MKAIILAAGKWTRLQPLTLEIPKAMVEVFWKSLLEYNMQVLLPYVDEFIIVVKYKKDHIMRHFGDEYKWVKVKYHEQWEESGTWAAVKWIKTSWNIVIAYCDAIFSQRDIDAVMQEKWHAVLAKEVPNPEKYGIFSLDSEWYIKKVIEKPQANIGNIANFWFFKVNDSILNNIEKVELSPRWEIEITDAINMFVTQNKVKPVIMKHRFIDITSMEDLEKAHSLKKPVLWKTKYLESIWNYELYLWIPQSGISEIVDYSLDSTDIALREWTSDWKKRFISVENLTAWYYDDDRYPFTLLSEKWTVAWLWWWRPTQMPLITKTINAELHSLLEKNSHGTHTSWVRIYPFARGEKLASPFIKACSKYYDTIFKQVHMCIDIDEQNIPSQRAFEKIWFQRVGYGKNINNSPESWKQRFVYLKVS